MFKKFYKKDKKNINKINNIKKSEEQKECSEKKELTDDQKEQIDKIYNNLKNKIPMRCECGQFFGIKGNTMRKNPFGNGYICQNCYERKFK